MSLRAEQIIYVPLLKRVFDVSTSLIVSSGHLLLTRNFNFHVDNVQSDRDASAFLDLLHSFGLQQHIIESTHTRGHILDLLITKYANLMVNQSSSSLELPSEHTLVVCSLLIPRPSPTRVLVNHRKVRRINIDHFKQSVAFEFTCSSA